MGLGFDNYLEEANTGKGIKITRRLKPYFQFILPILILFIFDSGIFFKGEKKLNWRNFMLCTYDFKNKKGVFCGDFKKKK